MKRIAAVGILVYLIINLSSCGKQIGIVNGDENNRVGMICNSH
jgi:hypothetical protein